jgi:hypothetical protein
VKSAEEIMNMLDAFDLTGSLRDAGELAGVSHHTVARYVAVRESGLAVRGVRRPMLIDEFLPKVEEWVERSNGKVRADVAHDKLVALGFTGSERTTRRAVAAVKKNYRLGRVRVHRRWVTEPGQWAGCSRAGKPAATRLQHSGRWPARPRGGRSEGTPAGRQHHRSPCSWPAPRRRARRRRR